MATGISRPGTAGAGTIKRIGRPSKGKRDAILARPHESLGDTIRHQGLELRLTPGEYMVKLAAEQLGMPQYIPEPSIRTVSAAESERSLKDGRYSFLAKPPLAFGRVLKRRAKAANLSYGEYMVLLAAQALDDLEHAPQPSEQLIFPKGGALTAA